MYNSLGLYANLCLYVERYIHKVPLKEHIYKLKQVF